MKKALPLMLLILCLTAGGVVTAPTAAGQEYRRIHFPVSGSVTYSDDFGDPRSDGRTHDGNDLMGSKLQHLLSAVDGTVVFLRTDGSGASGNMVTIRDAEGWRYSYVHVNNDSPGTDDGANPPQWRFTSGVTLGAAISRGQHIGYLGDSGNAEGSRPHLHFEIRKPDGSYISPYTSLRLAQGLPAYGRCAYDSNPASTPSDASGKGYWIATSDGGVFTFGDAGFHGSAGGLSLKRPVVGMTPTASSNGYWLVASDGGIFSFGDAGFYGSTGAMTLNQPVVGMAATKTGQGYWLVASDGGIFSFGDAAFHGSTGAMRLNKPVVGMAVTPSGGGYWLVASDGGIFSFGDAVFYGSTGAIQLDKPIMGMIAPSAGGGYWLVASDGGMFTFGNLGYYGSLPGMGLCSWPDVVAAAGSASGGGYWMSAADGGLFTFGDTRYFGGMNTLGVTTAPQVAMAVAR